MLIPKVMNGLEKSITFSRSAVIVSPATAKSAFWRERRAEKMRTLSPVKTQGRDSSTARERESSRAVPAATHDARSRRMDVPPFGDGAHLPRGKTQALWKLCGGALLVMPASSDCAAASLSPGGFHRNPAQNTLQSLTHLVLGTILPVFPFLTWAFLSLRRQVGEAQPRQWGARCVRSCTNSKQNSSPCPQVFTASLPFLFLQCFKTWQNRSHRGNKYCTNLKKQPPLPKPLLNTAVPFQTRLLLVSLASAIGRKT